MFVADVIPTGFLHVNSHRNNRHKNTVKQTVSYLNLSEGNAANLVKLSSLHFERSLMTVIYPGSQAVHRLYIRRFEMAPLFLFLFWFISFFIFATCCLKLQLFICFITLLNYPFVSELY